MSSLSLVSSFLSSSLALASSVFLSSSLALVSSLVLSPSFPLASPSFLDSSFAFSSLESLSFLGSFLSSVLAAPSLDLAGSVLNFAPVSVFGFAVTLSAVSLLLAAGFSVTFFSGVFTVAFSLTAVVVLFPLSLLSAPSLLRVLSDLTSVPTSLLELALAALLLVSSAVFLSEVSNLSLLLVSVEVVLAAAASGFSWDLAGACLVSCFSGALVLGFAVLCFSSRTENLELL